MSIGFTTHRPLPKWEMSFEGSHISRIRTLEEDEFTSAQKILNTWTRLYFSFPRELTCGPRLSSSCSRSLCKGKVLVGEDAKGVAQVFARVITIPGGVLLLDDIVTAPWNNFLCKGFLGTVGPETFWSNRKVSEDLETLMAGHKVSKEELTTPHKGSGSIMMLALCHYAKFYQAPVLVVHSNEEGETLYSSIGMDVSRHERLSFRYMISDTNLCELDKRVSKYFSKPQLTA